MIAHPVELAFWAGVQCFTERGYTFGDPAPYVKQKKKYPPVQGDVRLLRGRKENATVVVEQMRLYTNPHLPPDAAPADGGFLWEPFSSF